MVIRMALRFAAILLAFLATVNSQPSPVYTTGNNGNLGVKVDHLSGRFVSDESPTFVTRPSLPNCAVEGQAWEQPREYQQGKELYNKIPIFRLESPRPFIEERYFMPMGGLRAKKAQKAILLDVGDYVVKSNGSPGEPNAARSPGGTMGGILRSSG